MILPATPKLKPIASEVPPVNGAAMPPGIDKKIYCMNYNLIDLYIHVYKYGTQEISVNYDHP